MSGYSLGVLVLLLVGLADARPVTWFLVGARMADGAIATGSFVYDADTNTFSGINITTSGGTVFAGARYTATAPAAGVLSDATRAILVTVANLSDYTGTPALAIYPATPLTNGGGVVNLLGSSRSNSFETTCDILFNTLCDSPGVVRRFFVAGAITSTLPTSVPTLSTFGLVLLGLVLMSFSLLRLRNQQHPLRYCSPARLGTASARVAPASPPN